MSKSEYLYPRYYLGEATNSITKNISEYADFYTRKYAEFTKYQHKRALTLTSRNLVQFIFCLLVKNQLYTNEKPDTKANTKSNGH